MFSALLANDPALARQARFTRLRFAVLHGDQVQMVSVVDGAVDLQPGSATQAADFTLHASEAAWAEFAQAVPRPGFHDVIAMVECGHARLEGDALPFFRHLLLVKALLAHLHGKAWS